MKESRVENGYGLLQMIGWFPPMSPLPCEHTPEATAPQVPITVSLHKPSLVSPVAFPRVKIVRTMVLKQDSHPDISMFKLSKFSCSF